MSGSSLQFAFLNSTTIENLTRRTKVWQLAFYIARPLSSQAGIGFPSVTYPLADETSANPSKRTFMILHSKPGDNPWDQGAFANFKSVMGLHWYDWFFPLRHSPCCDHSKGESQFELGQIIERMRAEAGLTPSPPPQKSKIESIQVGKRDRPRRGGSEGGVRPNAFNEKDADASASRTKRMQEIAGDQTEAMNHDSNDGSRSTELRDRDINGSGSQNLS